VAGIFNTFKFRFKNADVLIKLIIINALVFVILGTISVISTLFKVQIPDLNYYLGVPANIGHLITKPWTLITYMFVHANLFHIFFNMLMLYWFGKIFLTYFRPKNMGALYILGGLGGAILYIVAFNTIPFYLDIKDSIMVGASGSVMAIIFASAFYNPRQELILLFLGRVKIIYIAIFLFLLDFLALHDAGNPGGHVAHIGGAAAGLLFALQYKNGRDITKWLNKFVDFFINIFKRRKKVKLKVKHVRNETDYEYNQRKHQDSENIDSILDKIKMSGYSSLTKDEKKKLFDASRKQ